MTTTGIIAIAAIGLVAVASAVIGSLGVRVARSTSDFFVASRTVGPMVNAGAISGEYLSAASFLGIAGLILRDGVDALWYPVGYTAGYLALVLFVSAPLRRSGAYTVPDFAEFRLRSGVLRRVCAVFVVIIGWLYLLPQLQGAGLTVTTVTGLPGWTGATVAALIVVATVVLGGMRSITFVQAFQYWLKLTALALPAIIAAIFFFSDDRTFDRPAPPQFPDHATVEIRTDVELQVEEPVEFTGTGVIDGRNVVDGRIRWEIGRHTVQEGAQLEFPAGAAVPVVAGAPASDASWLAPFPEGREHGLLATYSLIIALFLGTMGLPHVLVRFYTNPDGRAARRSAVFVLALLGCFYLAVTLLGALSRLYTPQLLVNGDTDAAVLLLPPAVLGSGLAGALLGGLVAAGAWAAFLSTSSGLVVSIAGVLSTDLIGSSRVRDFRWAAIIAGAVPLGLAVGVTRLDFSEAVALVFAVAASTFCPLLVLGIWWRGLTAAGGIAGVLVGGIGSAGAVALSLAGVAESGPLGVLLYRPALATVPAAFVVMIVVSRLTARHRPVDADQVLLRLHAPERLGLSRDRLEDRQRPTW
ncbi:sodium/solute symporter [Pseudonocardia adelaidensis]|uniref:Cation acetate symporter n=1 Tax=Pseudonocardia adelaidensis TaxID=648754 RepID=A0ABP9NP56_9PSEU